MYRVPKGRFFQFGDVIGCSLTLVKQALRKQQYAENSRKAFTDGHGRMDAFQLQRNEIILVSNLSLNCFIEASAHPHKYPYRGASVLFFSGFHRTQLPLKKGSQSLFFRVHPE